MIAPLTVNQQTVGLVEIFQRSDSGPTTQRGYLRFLLQMCGAANNFLNCDQLREFDGQQQMWQQLDHFIRNIHENLNVDQSMFAIANEGRRVIDCDRVSVALKRGSKFQIKAVSGLDSVERRADQVSYLSKLTRAVARTNEPLWYSGDDEQLPPQIESLLHNYVDLSHSKIVGIIPLFQTSPEDIGDREKRPQRKTKKVIGAMIVEQLGDETLSRSLTNRTQTCAEHSGLALSNAITHNSILFAGVLAKLGQVTAIAKLRNLPKTLLVLAILLGGLAILSLTPVSFDLGAEGELKPETTHEVYAQTAGTLMELFVPENPDEMVFKDQKLARMENTDLLVEVRDLQGKIDQAEEKIEKFNRAQGSELDRTELLMMEAEMDEAFVEKETYINKLNIRLRELEELEIVAPADGHVVNWKLREHLMRRPVERGQNLMTIVDPNTEWLVELELPERRTMHLMKALQNQTEPISVTFTLASHPGKEFQGSLQRVDEKLEVHSESQNSLRVIVGFDESEMPPELLRDGTRVTAKIDAGTRSLGYVWMHELYETVQTTVMFWF